MRTLYLHIGQGKTGTSFLQSCFALSRSALATSGIRYPRSAHHQQAAAGRTTTGNGHLIRSMLGSATSRRVAGTALRASNMRHASSDLLFSSEFFFAGMSTKGRSHVLPDFARHAGYDQIKVLMLIRDPVEHVVSSYLQYVRRSGGHETLSDVAARFRLPHRTAQVLASHTDPMFEFTVLNYSRVANNLADEAAKWLSLPASVLTKPAQNRVNRSLTKAETAFQRALNARLGKCSDVFADDICEAMPNIPHDPPRLTATDIAALQTRLAPAIAEVNAQIDPAHAYRFAPGLDAGDASTSDITISRGHLRQITALLAAKIRT